MQIGETDRQFFVACSVRELLLNILVSSILRVDCPQQAAGACLPICMGLATAFPVGAALAWSYRKHSVFGFGHGCLVSDMG